MPDDIDQRDYESIETAISRFIPSIPASAHKNESDTALTGGWDKPWGSTGWGFQAMHVEVRNLSTTNVLDVSFDGGTTSHRISIGDTLKFTRRNDDGHNFALQGTAAEPYEVNVEK